MSCSWLPSCCGSRRDHVLNNVVKPASLDSPPGLELQPTFSSNEPSPSEARLMIQHQGSPFPFDEDKAVSSTDNNTMKDEKDAAFNVGVSVTVPKDISLQVKGIDIEDETMEGIEDDEATERPMKCKKERLSIVPPTPSTRSSHPAEGTAFSFASPPDLFSPKARVLKKMTATTTTTTTTTTAAATTANTQNAPTTVDPPATTIATAPRRVLVSRRSSKRTLRPRTTRAAGVGIDDVVAFTHQRRNVTGKILRKGKMGLWVVALYGPDDTMTAETIAKRTKTLTKVQQDGGDDEEQTHT